MTAYALAHLRRDPGSVHLDVLEHLEHLEHLCVIMGSRRGRAGGIP